MVSCIRLLQSSGCYLSFFWFALFNPSTLPQPIPAPSGAPPALRKPPPASRCCCCCDVIGEGRWEATETLAHLHGSVVFEDLCLRGTKVPPPYVLCVMRLLNPAAWCFGKAPAYSSKSGNLLKSDLEAFVQAVSMVAGGLEPHTQFFFILCVFLLSLCQMSRICRRTLSIPSEGTQAMEWTTWFTQQAAV